MGLDAEVLASGRRQGAGGLRRFWKKTGAVLEGGGPTIGGATKVKFRVRERRRFRVYHSNFLSLISF